MTFKEFKKQNHVKNDVWLSFDWDIYCDMAERAGYDPTNTSMEDHFGGHREYLESNNIDLWHNYIFINDQDFIALEHFSNEAFLREYFFDNYEVAESHYDDEYGLVVTLVHN